MKRILCSLLLILSVGSSINSFAKDDYSWLYGIWTSRGGHKAGDLIPESEKWVQDSPPDDYVPTDEYYEETNYYVETCAITKEYIYFKGESSDSKPFKKKYYSSDIFTNYDSRTSYKLVQEDGDDFRLASYDENGCEFDGGICYSGGELYVDVIDFGYDLTKVKGFSDPDNAEKEISSNSNILKYILYVFAGIGALAILALAFVALSKFFKKTSKRISENKDKSKSESVPESVPVPAKETNNQIKEDNSTVDKSAPLPKNCIRIGNKIITLPKWVIVASYAIVAAMIAWAAIELLRGNDEDNNTGENYQQEQKIDCSFISGRWKLTINGETQLIDISFSDDTKTYGIYTMGFSGNYGTVYEFGTFQIDGSTIRLRDSKDGTYSNIYVEQGQSGKILTDGEGHTYQRR